MKSTVAQFRFLAIAEGISYLLLGITMPLKYQLDIFWPNKIVGYAHGLLFILYVIWLVLVWIKLRWSFLKALLGFLASLIPFGTFVFERKALPRS